MVSTTLVIATRAPKVTMSAAQLRPAPSDSAMASGASCPASWSAGSAPTATVETRM